jgi:predicted unusual protein kinase regulating ubiquinone biosynthesis (AarF/ABC1/UbiB family)
VPSVEWERTARDVLTLEWIDGIKLSDVAGLRAAGHDLAELARTLMQSFLRHALRDGFFHADMHQGNLFVDGNGDIVAVDFGIMGRLSHAERRFLAEILFGFIRRDYRRVAEVHFEAGYVPDGHSIDDFAQALRAIGEPIHGQRARDISMARLLTLLFEVTELFDMQTRPELIMVQKTMVVVEGVSRSLDRISTMAHGAGGRTGSTMSARRQIGDRRGAQRRSHLPATPDRRACRAPVGQIDAWPGTDFGSTPRRSAAPRPARPRGRWRCGSSRRGWIAWKIA